MTLDTPPTMKRQLAYVGLLFVSLAAIGVALYALIASFRYFDIDVAFWYYFGGFVFVALLGLLGLELSTARIKTM
ncbi:hypothetical protein A9R05_23060 [Burkholderia sp. KK1]|nr:hypothetical protein A9R05_23060 [Burkholderia sp. KK1]